MNLKKLTQINNPNVLISYSIIIAALLISISILGLSGGIEKGVRSAKKYFQSLQNIEALKIFLTIQVLNPF